MTNEINLEGNDNIVVQDSENVNITVNKILSKSHDYNTMLNELSYEQEIYDGIAEDNISLRLKVSTKINELTNRIEQFKREIIQLAETFDRLQVNSERLQQAREFFEKGEIGEARALLNDDNERIADEETQLWRKRDYYKTEIEPKLIAKSEERLIQALLSQTDYDNPNWFADTCNYFELSVKSHLTEDNLFEYAMFLQNHNQFDEAETFYFLYLNHFSHELTNNDRSHILNNLAILHTFQNKHDKALQEYQEALQIRQLLAEENPQKHLPEVAQTLNNLATLQYHQHNFDLALYNFQESLKIFIKLSENEPLTYLSDASQILGNIGLLHSDQNKFNEALEELQQSLTYKRMLAEISPNKHLPDVAIILNNLAIVNRNINKYESAVDELEESLKIRRNLAKTNPKVYLPYVAGTLNNLANLHSLQHKMGEALKEYEEALVIRRQLAETSPIMYLPDVAQTLGNIAVWHIQQGKVDDSLKFFNESTEIYRTLANKSFKLYFPELARNLANIALLYQEDKNEPELSIKYAVEAISILLPYKENVPYTEEYYRIALNVLRDWNLSDEEIDRMIAERMKENE